MGRYSETSNTFEQKFIIAISEGEAILKFITIVDRTYTVCVTANFLCKRDEIIPTTDPAIEFAQN